MFKKIIMTGVLAAVVANASNKDTNSVLNLGNQLPFKKENKNIQTLFSESFKVMGIALMKGQNLEKHQTPTPAFLMVQEGNIEYRINNEKYVLKAGDYLKIPAKIDHELTALEDSKLILIK